MIATGIHRVCLIRPTLVFRPEHKCISLHRTLLGANAHITVIEWFTCIPHLYGDDIHALKLYYQYVVSQPATDRILVNDVQVVTAPPYYLWAVKVTQKTS